MLQSLSIKNFRCFSDLTIASLNQVNLIIGKNNTGKSTLLDALALYATQGSTKILMELMMRRKEISEYGNNDNNESIEKIMNDLSFMFTNRNINFSDSICIKGVENLNEHSLTISMKKYREEKVNDFSYETVFLSEKDRTNDYEVGLNIQLDKDTNLIPLNRLWRPYRFRSTKYSNGFQYVGTTSKYNSELWDKIALTYKETLVVEALQIIEPKIERLAFVERERDSREDGRIAVVKLTGKDNIFPLNSMGDGINRILTIILSLVNAEISSSFIENGFLLIDEFENGLHYTVQEKLWQLIFTLAGKLNVQVFATTHSEDCIRTFENVLNNYSLNIDGKIIRLDRKGDNIVQVEFDKTELKAATDFGIEIR